VPPKAQSVDCCKSNCSRRLRICHSAAYVIDRFRLATNGPAYRPSAGPRTSRRPRFGPVAINLVCIRCRGPACQYLGRPRLHPKGHRGPPKGCRGRRPTTGRLQCCSRAPSLEPRRRPTPTSNGPQGRGGCFAGLGAQCRQIRATIEGKGRGVCFLVARGFATIPRLNGSCPVSAERPCLNRSRRPVRHRLACMRSRGRNFAANRRH